MHGKALRSTLTTAALVLALGACRNGGDTAPPGSTGKVDKRPDREWTDAARVEAIASTLQACSYEGDPVKVASDRLNAPAPADCRGMVDRIMGYTGLPANFVVTAGPVPNALAVILLDNQKLPQRVIAFNPDFIGATERATGNDTWAPISIMAHEIGHHLSGHTITNGGSRPEIELEADKFSGYVLYKMGAPLADATKAIMAMGSDTDQPTHPGKGRRADAITQGWQEACRQAGGNCSSSATTSPASPTPTTSPTAPPAAPATTARPSLVASLPMPSASSIPFKYGRFVVDETGKLDAGKLAELDQKLQTLAKEKGTELAVLFVNDLHGMTPNDYAWAMMRQLRIGKLDLGNGGVIVIAPAQGVSGGAFAPGVAKKLEFFDPTKRFDSDFRIVGWDRGCLGPNGCSSFTAGLTDVIDFVLRDLDTKWEIRFNSIEDAIAFSKARLAERRAGRKWDDKIDQPLGSLARFTGTVTDTAPKPGPAQPTSAQDMRVNPRIVADGRWQAILVKTDDGQETTLYMQPQTALLMPSGKLQTGKRYTFVGELNSTGQFHTDQGVIQINPNLWLFSYEAL